MQYLYHTQYSNLPSLICRGYSSRIFIPAKSSSDVCSEQLFSVSMVTNQVNLAEGLGYLWCMVVDSSLVPVLVLYSASGHGIKAKCCVKLLLNSVLYCCVVGKFAASMNWEKT